MRNIFPSLLLLSAFVLTGCHDDDSSPVAPLQTKTFSDSSGLELYYNGVAMPGKSVTFSQDGDKATVTSFSLFDLSQLSQPGLSGQLPSPGIVPGSPETVWNVTLTNSGGFWQFSGEDENDFVKYSYEGQASPEKLKIEITDAVLKNPAVSPAAWKPVPLARNADGSFKSIPFYIDWQYEPIPDVDIDLSKVLQALTVLPVIPVYGNTAYMSVSQALSEVVKAVAFRPDGNVLLTYVSSTGGAAHIAQTNANGLQYVVAAPGILKFYVNPLSLSGFILENMSGGTPATDVDLTASGLFPAGGGNAGDSGSQTSPVVSELGMKLLMPLLKALLPELARGIPMAYTLSPQSLYVFIDTDMALALMRQVFAEIISDSATIKAIGEYIASSESLAPLLPKLEQLPQLLQTALERTSVFRIGFAFTPYAG